MDWPFELLMIFRVFLAALLGAVIGWEREHHGRDAGLRTYAAVALGACVFGLVSLHAVTPPDTRIAAQVVTGVGFLGAGVIFRSGQGQALGLTTAATLWATAAVGLGIAFGMYLMSVCTAAILLGLLALHHLPAYRNLKRDVNGKGEAPKESCPGSQD